ncbi:ATP-dependent Clp protease proteolytic subunit [Streptomyces sp. NPDC126514]|uniref:ATP-dependent Clp protease proteolytic subunit n=1 Tax=Streptomyces sp. NPDC126514 TaxID=3155210 RepID=UPI003334404C
MTDRTDSYAKLLEERIVLLGTRVDDGAANDVIAQFILLEHQSPDRDISLYVNSPGGPFSAMSAIYDTLRHVTCDVETVLLGHAGPTAAVLLAAGTPGKRYALPDARVVLGQPAPSEPVEGRVSDLAAQAEELARVGTVLEGMLARHTGRSPQQVHEDIERDKVLDAQQALEYGLVDGIVPSLRAPRTTPGAR